MNSLLNEFLPRIDPWGPKEFKNVVLVLVFTSDYGGAHLTLTETLQQRLATRTEVGTLNPSILAAAKSETIVPVSCTEACRSTERVIVLLGVAKPTVLSDKELARQPRCRSRYSTS